MAKGKHIEPSAEAAMHASHASAASPALHASHPSVSANALKGAVAALAATALAACLGIGFANAGSLSTTFYAPEKNASGSGESSGATSFDNTVQIGASQDETFILETMAARNATAGVAEIAAEEEAARKLAEERARSGEQAAIEYAQAAQEASAANGGVGAYDVDFTVGRDAFVKEWTARIDAYLSGTALEGYGSTFAAAAWENGVDPRWSPAISHTESTNGANCFLPHNAWGWTGGSWGSWEEAIHAHVNGLSLVYGYTISYSNAKRYCPPNYDNWYNNTLNEMQKI